MVKNKGYYLHMAFEKIKYLLPYAMHKIEEKMCMKPEEANKLYEEERENENQYWINYWKEKRKNNGD